MKILSITAQKPHSTGSGTYLTELVKSFNAAGHEQAIVAGVYADDEVDFPVGVKFYPVVCNARPCKARPGLALHALRFPIVGMSDVMPYESTRYQDMTPSMIQEFEDGFVHTISQAIEEFNPDLIICHHLFLLTSLVRKHFPDQKIYGICHGTCLRQMRNAEEYNRQLALEKSKDSEASRGKWFIDISEIKSNIANLDKIFALHDAQASDIAEIFGCASEVIGSGYNAEIFNMDGRDGLSARTGRLADGSVLSSGPVRICYAGKISAPKGVPELIRVLSALHEEFEQQGAGLPTSASSFEVTLAGGCQDPELEKTLSSLPPFIQYLGPLPQTELATVYKQNDILVLPSYFEGLSLVPIEAMACGLLPICTDLPGMKAWIDTHVVNSNIRYIKQPEMATIDTPTDAGRAAFIHDLTEILRTAIQDIQFGRFKQEPIPDTSAITWDKIAMLILSST